MSAFSAHQAEKLAESVSNEINHFRSIGHDFEWKAYSHDEPEDLVERLGSMGFSIGPPEVVVVAEAQQVLHGLGDSPFEVRHLTDPDELDDYMVII